jgi:hypothetical protein
MNGRNASPDTKTPDAAEAGRRRLRAESPEIGAMLDRVCRALVRRATDGDLLAIEELALLERTVTDHLRDAARGAHDGDAHYSWTEIGIALGVSRQNARQRFGTRMRTHTLEEQPT